MLLMCLDGTYLIVLSITVEMLGMKLVAPGSEIDI